MHISSIRRSFLVSLTFSSRLVHKYIVSEKNLEGERGDGMTNTFEQHHLLVMGQICCMENQVDFFLN